MAQWINVLQNNSLINLPRLPLLCEKTGAIALVQPSHMTGKQAGRQSATAFRDFKNYTLDDTLEI